MLLMMVFTLDNYKRQLHHQDKISSKCRLRRLVDRLGVKPRLEHCKCSVLIAITIGPY